MKVYQDLKYADQSDLQKLDLYVPTDRPGPFPVLVFIHGGAWKFGDKRDSQEQDWLDLVENGYAVASINYRLNDEVKHPDGLLDCRRAINYIAEVSEDYDLDPNRIAVAGASAGGYYALMLALTKNIDKFSIPDKPNADIKACIVWYAPTDFYSAKKSVIGSLLNRIKYGVSIAIAEDYFGKPLKKLTKEELQNASPINYVTKDIPPILMQQGDNDFVIPYEQADLFCKKADKEGAGSKVTVEIFSGASHVDPMFASPENKRRIKEFLDEAVELDSKQR